MPTVTRRAVVLEESAEPLAALDPRGKRQRDRLFGNFLARHRLH